MHKTSTPGDRHFLRTELPRVVTKLELMLPVYVNTMVMHILVFETVAQLEETGPFPVAMMLDIERFQTVFKRCCRGTKNAMISILNHYMLLDVALSNRLLQDQTWTAKPPQSTAAGHAAREGSTKRKDRLWAVKGKGVAMELDDGEMKEVEDLWCSHVDAFAAFLRSFRDARRQRRRCVRGVTDFRAWRRPVDAQPFSEQEINFQHMSRDVTVTCTRTIVR